MTNDEDNTLERIVGIVILTILLIVFGCSLISTSSCVTERKEIQVERKLVTIKRIDTVERWKFYEAKITWRDENMIEYFEFSPLPHKYKKGQSMYVLLRR